MLSTSTIGLRLADLCIQPLLTGLELAWSTQHRIGPKYKSWISRYQGAMTLLVLSK
jgi:hypothetical protein